MKKAFSIIGIVASVALVAAGVTVLTSLFGYLASGHVGDPHGSYGTSYDYGYATFGADFYNYVSNNAGLAAYGAQRAAGNLSEIFDLLRFALGVTMICFGLGGVAAFGVVLSGCKNAARGSLSVPVGAGPLDPVSGSFDSPLPPREKPFTPEPSVPASAAAVPPAPQTAVIPPEKTARKEYAAPVKDSAPKEKAIRPEAVPRSRTAPTKEGVVGTWVLESGYGMRLSSSPDNADYCVKMEILPNGVIHGYKNSGGSRSILQWDIVNNVLKIWWGDISKGFGAVNAFEIAGNKMLSTDGSNTVYAKRG